MISSLESSSSTSLDFLKVPLISSKELNIISFRISSFSGVKLPISTLSPLASSVIRTEYLLRTAADRPNKDRTGMAATPNTPKVKGIFSTTLPSFSTIILTTVVFLNRSPNWPLILSDSWDIFSPNLRIDSFLFSKPVSF